jgi:uncharacterized membrane protein
MEVSDLIGILGIIIIVVILYYVRAWEKEDLYCPLGGCKKGIITGDGYGRNFTGAHPSLTDTFSELANKAMITSRVITADVTWRKSLIMAIIASGLVYFCIIQRIPRIHELFLTILLIMIPIYACFSFHNFHHYSHVEKNMKKIIELMKGRYAKLLSSNKNMLNIKQGSVNPIKRPHVLQSYKLPDLGSQK